MFGNNIPTTGLTFSKVLSGISKSLNIANQVIPLYQQAKPMIKNAKTIMSVLKDFNPQEKNKANNIIKPKESNNEIEIKPQNIKNGPMFFQ